MTIEIGLLVLLGGVVGVIFNKPLAKSMLKFHPEDKHATMFVVGRIAYVLIGFWMIFISTWVLYRAM